MEPAILGKKIGMTQVYDKDGVLHPVTVVQAGPCSVLQVKTAPTDGYEAVQIGYGEVKPHRATKPAIGHAAKAGCKPQRAAREIRSDAPVGDVAPGQELTVEIFDGVSHVDVIGTTKGRGYAGVMKRHGFKGMPASHGCERKHRHPGSIASHSSNAGTGPKPKKGKRMAGHMGAARCTSRNHKLVAIDKENHLLLIKGPLPGANGGLLYVRKSKTARVRL
ncbi:MAG TPA: 50S ribosomal protein L3 [Phycisphaerae bacterium]|nr:50S ribosomal protein L3 [Phycisphaerae bacterium]